MSAWDENNTCVSRNSIANLEGIAHEYQHDDWVAISTSRRAAAILTNITFGLELDPSENYFSTHHEQSSEIWTLLGELNGLMREDGVANVGEFVESVRTSSAQTPYSLLQKLAMAGSLRYYSLSHYTDRHLFSNLLCF